MAITSFCDIGPVLYRRQAAQLSIIKIDVIGRILIAPDHGNDIYKQMLACPLTLFARSRESMNIKNRIFLRRQESHSFMMKNRKWPTTLC
jgi:hypothetical protein